MRRDHVGSHARVAVTLAATRAMSTDHSGGEATRSGAVEVPVPPHESSAGPAATRSDAGQDVASPTRDAAPSVADDAAWAREPAVPVAPAGAARPLIDFGRTARRLAIAVAGIGVVVLATWIVLAVTGGASLRLLAELAGVGLLGAFVVEVVVVGGSAVRGMLRAGERGERLAASDVALVPPQLLRRSGR